jgi:molecular chaperone DnaK
MSAPPCFLGIDLGTTNSAQAVHDGTSLKLVRSVDGSVLTPSVVRIDGRGRVSVGTRARGRLATDPENTRAEFKRLMGSAHRLAFADAGVSRTPAELSSEVLKALRHDFAEQFGHEPARAIISVPALFELPQLEATSEAARLAGFERVEFIQEPIASAMAAGWSVDNPNSGTWLVYDLGGGTFDASLLETREGLLRVVGHDGDNFLGGRDIDQGLADWALKELASDGIRIDVSDPAMAPALRRLRASCELAKIELTRAAETDLQIDRLLEQNGRLIAVDLVISRGTLARIVASVVDRSIAVCQRLLRSHGLRPEQLERIVLVGGPTIIPGVRERIASALAAPLQASGDPLTLVAEGASLFALSQSLSTVGIPVRNQRAPGVWLQYSAVSSDLTPFVVGKVNAEEGGERVVAVVLERTDAGFRSEEAKLDADRAFAVPVQLIPRGRAVFKVWGQLAGGARVALEPHEFTIAHGVSIGDPPLSRTVGVALANDGVQVFFEKGSPLPARRSFVLQTAETVSPGNIGFALRVPIIQGEFPFAHLCRLVGTLEIAAEHVRATVPLGSSVDVTLEFDRGGRLVASARIPAIDQNFQHVAHLVAPDLSPDAMRGALRALEDRLAEIQREAFRERSPEALRPNQFNVAEVMLFGDTTALVAEARRAIDLAAGGDPDASERARRLLLDLDAAISQTEQLDAWPKLEAEARHRLAVDSSWVGQYGTDTERQLFSQAVESVERALKAKNPSELKRQLQAAERIGTTAYFRDPDAWPRELEAIERRIHELADPMRGKALIEEAHRALLAGNHHALESTINKLRALLPRSQAQKQMGYDSGVR